jgi:hypothetical protein
VEAPPFAEGGREREREPFTQEAVHKLERGGRGGRSFARRIALLDGSNHKWRRTLRPCQDAPLEEKEDTLGSITMINGATPSTFTG